MWGPYGLGHASRLAFQLPPAGGDALLLLFRRREKEGGPQIRNLGLGRWSGLRAGPFAWRQRLEALPMSLPRAPGLWGGSVALVQGEGWPCTVTQSSASGGSASASPRTRGGTWVGALSVRHMAEAWKPHAFGLHGSQMKPRVVAGAAGIHSPQRHLEGASGRPGGREAVGLGVEVGRMRMFSPRGLGAPAPERLPPSTKFLKARTSFLRRQSSRPG